VAGTDSWQFVQRWGSRLRAWVSELVKRLARKELPLFP
ncbi:uncharacterized protein METZ01_LOCUS470441, partial [marine metagenome]